MLKIRRSRDHLIFNMGIPILGKDGLYIETGPRSTLHWYHNDTVASQITSLTVVYSIVYSGTDQRNIKAPRHWPLCGEFTGTGEFPVKMACNAENGSIWWRHHELWPRHQTSPLSLCQYIFFRSVHRQRSNHGRTGYQQPYFWDDSVSVWAVQ